jgi:hypothetical protein
MGILINYSLYRGAIIFLHAPLLVALAIGTIVAAVFNFLRYRVVLQ